MSNLFTTIVYNREIQEKCSLQFQCGNEALDLFLQSGLSLDASFGKTFVTIFNDRIIGYYNIGTGHIEDENVIRYGGSVYINYLAVDQSFQKVKINEEWYFSDVLMLDCIGRIKKIRENDILGFTFITLSSTEEGIGLYSRNGFELLEDDMIVAKNEGEYTCKGMYLPLDVE